MKTLIKNGTLITASETYQADILVEDEKISRIGIGLEADSAQVVDASGKLILPGGVDPHTHFDLPMFDTVSSDDHYTGHKAAAFGGTTTALDFASFDFDTIKESVDAWRKKAEKAAIDYSFHMNLTKFNDKIAKEIPSLRDMGITTLKVFTAYNGRLRLDDGSIFRALQITKENGMLVMVHCENGDVIDTLIPQALAAGSHKPRMARVDETRLGRSRSHITDGRHVGAGRCAGVYRAHERRRRSGYASLSRVNAASR